MTSLDPLASHQSWPQFLFARGIDPFRGEGRDVAELLRNSASVLVVGVHALGFVESRSDSTTRTGQPQRTAPRLKSSDIRQRFNQRLLSLSSVTTPTAPSPNSARAPPADTDLIVRLIFQSARVCSPACWRAIDRTSLLTARRIARCG